MHMGAFPWLLIDEGPAHCSQCHPWAGLDPVRKVDEEPLISRLPCLLLQAPLLAGWWTVICKLKETNSSLSCFWWWQLSQRLKANDNMTFSSIVLSSCNFIWNLTQFLFWRTYFKRHQFRLHSFAVMNTNLLLGQRYYYQRNLLNLLVLSPFLIYDFHVLMAMGGFPFLAHLPCCVLSCTNAID